MGGQSTARVFNPDVVRDRWPCSGRRSERHPPHQVVGERVPHRDRLHLAQTTHQKLPQSTPAGDGVHTLGRRRALGVNTLGLRCTHARAPAANDRAVLGTRHMSSWRG